MKVIVVSAFILVSLILIIVSSIVWLNTNEVVMVENENEIIKMGIHPNCHLWSDFLIQIDTNHVIRTYYGTRNEITKKQ